MKHSLQCTSIVDPECGPCSCGATQPHALTREQVEEYTTRFYNCGFLYLKKVFDDHDAAQRLTIDQQAQEIEQYKAAILLSDERMARFEHHLASMTAERDEIAARWRHDFELRCDEEEKNEQLNKQLAASQARVRELEEEKANAEPDTRLFITVTDHESQLATLQATLAERERDINQAEGVIMLREAICRHSEPLPQVFAACHASGGHASQLGD